MGRALQRGFTRLHCQLYRTTGGAVGAHLRGSPVMLLRTTGRRTGLRRETPVLYFPEGSGCAIVASNGGAAHHPAWFLNLERDPSVEAQMGGAIQAMRARPTRGEERERLWQLVTDQFPGYLHYQVRTSREI